MENLILKNKLTFYIASINKLLEKQLVKMLANPKLQELMSVWLELYLICHTGQSSPNVSIKLLNITWQEIDKDLSVNVEIENTALFQLCYESEFGLSGGEPFGIFLGCYALDLENTQLISTLNNLGQLASRALAPFISNVSATTFHSESFTNLSNTATEFDVAQLSSWQRLRLTQQARFINLCLPHCNIALNYPMVNALMPKNTLKIGSASILTMRIIQSFQHTNWFNEILGFFDLQELVNPLNKGFTSATLECNPELFLTHIQEQSAVKLGLIPIIQNKIDSALFFGSNYSSYNHTDLAQLLLEHILCGCRFAHYIKVIARDKIGTYMDEKECENWIQNWLKGFQSNLQTQQNRYHYPLKNARIKISKSPGKVGYYNCQILLEPHMKLELINSQISLSSEIASLK